jgi:phage baseplate assembly protein W
MNHEFYSIPLIASDLMKQKQHPMCSLHQSVAQQLHLIITTAFGEMPADEAFGCSIWEYEFDNISGVHKLKELIRQSLVLSIQLYEKRLNNVYVELMMRQEEPNDSPNGLRIKKRISITIKGLLKATNENFTYNDNFFVGPLSY